MRAVVTGGAGFVGTNLISRLVFDGREVVLFDNLSRPGVEENLTWIERRFGDAVEVQLGDIRDPRAVRRAVIGATEVYHLAAQVAVTTSLEAPQEDFRINAEGTLTLLEELRGLATSPFLLFTSTNKVYGSLSDLALVRCGSRWAPADPRVQDAGLSEEQPLDFSTPYGCSKGAADQYVLDYAKSFGIPSVVFRMSCIYGPHQHGTEDQGWVAHFVLRALQGRPITLYGDGAQVRDILFVDDLVEAMVSARDEIEHTAGRAFNMGGGPANAVSLLDVVDLLTSFGAAVKCRFATERPGDQRYYVADSSRFSQLTGWVPRVPAEDGIGRLHAWLGAHRIPHPKPAIIPVAAR
jgi:CDP-paratose 2-epimerase